ncbi:MAG: 1-deoxy-D-xylulose-5-phosphate reductoisomerase [Bacteroidetes bacterium]|nr:1-deoxy-D-xylulose-5-phosphate reductoisomerase [Bacteroidota bacterium]
MTKKNIAILGSTGSIGTQALEVIRNHPASFGVEILTANSNAGLLIRQALEFHPNAVAIADETKYEEVKKGLFPKGIKVFAGTDAIEQLMEMESIDMVLAAMVGFAGLKPVVKAIASKKDIALANKETLVVAGELISKLINDHNTGIIPVDSEHSAIFQCLAGENNNPVEKIYLTASGGPFRGKKRDALEKVTPHEALKHPNWNMGAKITVDSATLMNKGLEVIEAHWLFNLPPDRIDVVIHPQSIVHSIVQFEDGSMKAQMGLPDMRLPILYALGYPVRLKSDFPRFNFTAYPALTFEMPDMTTFRNLDLAYNAIAGGGNKPCILNAANEVAVDAFLKEKISFLRIPDIIGDCLNKIRFMKNPGLEDLHDTDRETRKFALSLIN